MESEGQRRRRLEALPARAEDEIVRVQNARLKRQLSVCKLENEALRLREANAGVVCTTLAEVVLKEVPETPEMCSSDSERAFDGVDPVVDGLASDCLCGESRGRAEYGKR